MKKFYIISNDFRNSVIQLTSNKSYAEIEPYLDQYSTEKLPNDVTFSVVKGKKWADLLYYHEAASIVFFSKKVINILSTIIDMKDLCYPIKIEAENVPQYYFIYNKVAYKLVNPDYLLNDFGEPPYLYIPQEELEKHKLFTHINGICNIVDEDIMQEMKKSKVTNIRFREIYVIDTGEYEELIRQHNQQKPFLP